MSISEHERSGFKLKKSNKKAKKASKVYSSGTLTKKIAKSVSMKNPPISQSSSISTYKYKAPTYKPPGPYKFGGSYGKASSRYKSAYRRYVKQRKAGSGSGGRGGGSRG